MSPKSDTIIIFIIGVLIAVTLVIYFIGLSVCFSKKIFIFSPYVPVPLPNSFHPTGGITELTPDEIADRAANIAEAIATLNT